MQNAIVLLCHPERSIFLDFFVGNGFIRFVECINAFSAKEIPVFMTVFINSILLN